MDVSGQASAINPESSTTESLTTRMEIVRSPDEDRTGSMAMITNNVPGTYVMHDHLHSRGGHGVAWQINGVPVPNSSGPNPVWAYSGARSTNGRSALATGAFAERSLAVP